MIKTKSIVSPKEREDGLRISIMSRHTLNDGITPRPEISIKSYDSWMPVFAPPKRLIGDYYKRGLSWEKFEERYLDYLRQPQIQKEVLDIANRGLEETITLLCVEDSPEFCHRRLLAEECKKYRPELVLEIG
jgi:uncharacterized protein YeaO (DUF488 family)